MSTFEEAGVVPAWTLGDRLRKARAFHGSTVKELATLIGVSDKTINNAEGDKVAVRTITLNAWALATGVSRSWLETGLGSPTPPDGPMQVPDEAERRRRADEGAARNRRRYGAADVTRRYALAAA